MVEMIIAHEKNYMNQLVEKLKKKYVNPNLMFDPHYFETQHPCELNPQFNFNSQCGEWDSGVG